MNCIITYSAVIAIISPRPSAQDIGTSLWSFATLEYFNDELYRGIVARVARGRAYISKPQEISNVVWAIATAEMEPSNIDTFDTTVLRQESLPNPKEVENDPITRCFALAAQRAPEANQAGR